MAAVGCRAIALGHALYPARAGSLETLERFGPYALSVARDAPGDGDDHPVVVISHGTGSSPWLFRDLAAHLVRAGFVVALPEHTGDSRSDKSLAGTVEMMQRRPQQLRCVIDALGATRVAIVGHSMGGYTALAVAGGEPMALPNQTADHRAHPVEVEHDPRAAALVLFAPATPWFMAPGALANVRVPILLFTGDADPFAPRGFTEIVLRGVVGPVEHRAIANAGHFACASPFPEAMVSASFPPSQDPPGFDRAAFQPILYAEVEAFLRTALR